ncbi:MAG: YggS family pyridoxal phosphate-dependent enzyme [Planctomycetes bacterium]|nr:YggS family pyridoxal phosphate-dependent enzyme [Planctomycetota bacterium]
MTLTPPFETLKRNLDRVRSRIEAACRRAGRRPDEVLLIAVTKYAPPPAIEALLELGVADVGEHRALEGAAKKARVSRPARWHFIGHLQTNKARTVVEHFQVVHSVDRPELAAELDKRCAAARRTMPIFVQVNVSGEASKGGYAPGDVEAAVESIRRRHPSLEIQGLMTIAAEGDPEAARSCFRALRELASRCGARGLSMGMSGDFEVAVEEGATCVRVGTAIFQGVASHES